MNKTTAAMILIVALIVAIVSPLLLIWSINTLFTTDIQYGFYEWLAALFLIGSLKGSMLKFKPNSD
jgi:hypothetical protein